MNTDYRISVGWRTSLKRQKLQRKLGDGGVLAVMDLWGAVAQDRPAGVLTGWTVEDIELAAGWHGEEGRLVAVLVELRLLDYDGATNAYTVHGWTEWNLYAAHADTRSEIARRAAAARWSPSKHAPSMPPACPEHAGGNAKSESSNAPSPEPVPVPEPESESKPEPPPTPPTTLPARTHATDAPGAGGNCGGGNSSEDPARPKPGGEAADIRDLLRLLGKYPPPNTRNLQAFLAKKATELGAHGLTTDLDRADLERLRAREAAERRREAGAEQERRAAEDEVRRLAAEQARLLTAFAELATAEREQVLSRAATLGGLTKEKYHTESRCWQRVICEVMRQRERGERRQSEEEGQGRGAELRLVS